MLERPTAAATSPPARALDARARIGVLATIPAVLGDFGLDPKPLFAVVGLRVQDLGDARRTIKLQQVDALLGACARESRCPAFGLLAGARVGIAHLGLVGRIAAAGDTVAQSLRDLTSMYGLVSTGGAPALAVHGDDAVLTYGFHAPGLVHADQAYDFVLAAMSRVMRDLCGESWRAQAVHLPRRRPADVQPYDDVFGAPLSFDAMHAALVMPVAVLSRRVPTADAALRRSLIERATSELTQFEPDLVVEVRRTIRTLLENGECSRSAVADRLHIHERALGRRLQRADTTFQALLEETRASVAQELLRATDATVARIATTVGYRDSTVFGRAFQRWTGMTPRRYRTAYRASDRAVDRLDPP